MRYFQVYREAFSQPLRERIASDGTPLDAGDIIDDVIIRLVVEEMDEAGVILDEQYYHGYDENDLLEQIKSDYPAGEWQNNDW